MGLIQEYIKKHVNDYTDSQGNIDTIDLIEAVQKEFGCSTHNAEEYVTDYIEALEGA